MKLALLLTILIICGCSKSDNGISAIKNEKNLLSFVNSNNLIDTSLIMLDTDYATIDIRDGKFEKVVIGKWPSYSIGDINNDGFSDILINVKSGTGIRPIIYSQTTLDSVYKMRLSLGPKLTNTFGEIVETEDAIDAIRIFRRSYNAEMPYFVNDTIFYMDSLYSSKPSVSAKNKLIDSIIIEEHGVWTDWKDRSSINFVDDTYFHARDFYGDSIWIDKGEINQYYINKLKQITNTLDLGNASQNFEADWTDDNTIKTIIYFQNYDSIVIEDYGLVGPKSLRNLYVYNHEMWNHIRNQ